MLVVVGGGFLGRHVAAELAGRGNDVRMYSRSFTPISTLAASGHVIEKIGDAAEGHSVIQTLRGADCLFYFAGTFLPQWGWDRFGDGLAAEIRALVAVLDASTNAGVGRVVFASSGGTVYGPVRRAPIDEGQRPSPISPYGITKLTMEHLLEAWSIRYGLLTNVLRIANAYGDGQQSSQGHGAVITFLERAETLRPITIWGDGTQIRDFVHVHDVACATASVWESKTAASSLNIGSGIGVSLIELATVVREITGVDIEIVREPARAIDVPYNVLNIELVTRLTGWRPSIDLREGIRRTWQWLRREQVASSR